MSKTILLVEDNPTLNSTLQHKLESENYSVVCAFNGEEGLQILENTQIDLILLDIKMPKMDGLEMIYRQSQKPQNPIPTIILTNLTETAYPKEIIKILVKSNTTLDQIINEIKNII